MGFHRRPHPQIGALLETGLIRLLRLRPDSCDLILDLLDFVLVAPTFVVRDLRFKLRDLLLVLSVLALKGEKVLEMYSTNDKSSSNGNNGVTGEGVRAAGDRLTWRGRVLLPFVALACP